MCVRFCFVHALCIIQLTLSPSVYNSITPLAPNSAKPYPHMKLVAVGNAGSGKTTLLQQLTKQGKKVRRRCHTIGDEMSASTETAGFVEWEYAPRSQKKVTFTTWDFGGQVQFCSHPVEDLTHLTHF